MAANQEILQRLNNHVFEKTGKRVIPESGGDGDKDKDKPKPPERVPLPDYNDPKSRLKYAQLLKEKYHLPAGYGDTFLRFNEVPDTRQDELTSKEIALKYAELSGIPAPLMYGSAMVEGMSGLYPQNGQVNYSGNEKFPVSGFQAFGLDTFGDAYKGLVKKGYLPADFNKQFIPATNTNEKGQKVNSANFANADAAYYAKAAMIRNAQDELAAYATKNKIPLSEKAKQFFTLAYYNGGSGGGSGLLNEYNKAGLLANDAFLNQKLANSKYGQIYGNVMDRWKLADALSGEGYFTPPTPPPAK